MHIIAPLVCLFAFPVMYQQSHEPGPDNVAISLPAPAAPPQAQDPGFSFERFDTNGNGRIEPNEMPAVRGPVRAILESRDVNGDGSLDRAEFQGTSRRIPRMPLVGIGPQRSFFESFDANKDGKVVRDEIPERLRPRFELLFKETGKEALTLEDFEKRTPQSSESKDLPLFDVLDSDDDGTVTRREITWASESPQSPVISLASGPLFKALRSSTNKSFTREQMDELLRPVVERENQKRTFDGLDVNKDGTISLDEAPPQLRGALEQFLDTAKLPSDSRLTFQQFQEQLNAIAMAPKPQAEPVNRIPAAFQLLDTNRDGFIQPAELQADIVAALGRLDRDGDNQLSAEEFMGILPGSNSAISLDPPQPDPQPQVVQPEPKPAPRRSTGGFLADFFARYDKDKNGKLTKAELPERVLAQLSRLDIDGDGAVSRAEMTEAMMAKQKR